MAIYSKNLSLSLLVWFQSDGIIIVAAKALI